MQLPVLPFATHPPVNPQIQKAPGNQLHNSFHEENYIKADENQ